MLGTTTRWLARSCRADVERRSSFGPLLRRHPNTTIGAREYSIAERLQGALRSKLKRRDPPTDALDAEDTENLPTAPSWTVKPRKRPITGSIDMAGSSIEALHSAFRAHDVRQAWQVYKQIFRSNTVQALHADDHSTLLGWLTTHTLPRLGALHASRVMTNMRRYGHRPDLRDYHAMMLCHLRNNDSRRCAETFKQITEEGERPDARAYNLLLAAYGQAKDLKGTLRVWDRMKRDLPGARADMDSWAIMIEACGSAGRIDEALAIYEQLNESKARLDRKVYEALIRSYGMNGMSAAALMVFRDLKNRQNGLEVDLETYDAIIRACHTAEDAETALELWQELLAFCASKSTASNSIPVVPLASTFSTALSIYSRQGDATRTVDLFRVRSEHYPPDADSYESLVWAHAHQNEWDGCIKWYDEMVGRGFMPNSSVVQVAMQAQKMAG